MIRVHIKLCKASSEGTAQTEQICPLEPRMVTALVWRPGLESLSEPKPESSPLSRGQCKVLSGQQELRTGRGIRDTSGLKGPMRVHDPMGRYPSRVNAQCYFQQIDFVDSKWRLSTERGKDGALGPLMLHRDLVCCLGPFSSGPTLAGPTLPNTSPEILYTCWRSLPGGPSPILGNSSKHPSIFTHSASGAC